MYRFFHDKKIGSAFEDVEIRKVPKCRMLSDNVICMVHIVAKQANRYTVAFHITISRYCMITRRRRSSDVGRRVGTVVHTEVRSVDAFTCRCRSTVFLETADSRLRFDVVETWIFGRTPWTDCRRLAVYRGLSGGVQ